MAVNGVALAAGSAGVILVWSALNNKGLLGTVKNVIQGKTPQPANPGGAASTTQIDVNAGIPGVTAGIPAGVAASGTPSYNKSLGLLMAAGYGWSGANEWPYLESGWEEESGWSQYAANDPSDPYNHAYGIPQANPGSKMSSAGADWKDSPSTQIKWGLSYIKAEYGSPSQVPGWTPNGPAAGYVGY
jgi:hypothetical protein